MSRWFRFYDESINDPKVQRLSADMFRAWVNMLCLASKYGGVIPKADIAFALRATEKGAAAIVDYLIDRDLLEDRGDCVTPHNWEGRQYKSDVTDPTAAGRQKKYRNNKRNADRNADRNASVTVTDTRTDTETEQKEIDIASGVHAEFLEIAKTDADDPALFGSLYGIQSLLSRGYSRETILAGAANAMRGKEKPPNWNYFAKAIETENQQRSAPAKKEKGAFVASQPATPDDKAVEFFKKFGRWHRDYGPEPGQHGCRASPEILTKHGYAPEAA